LSGFCRQDDHVEAPSGPKRLPHVAQRDHRVGEEHRSEATEGVVVGAGEARGLHVDDLEGHVVNAGLVGLLPCARDRPLGHVDAVSMSLRTHQPGELDGRVPQPAADVEHAVAGVRVVVGERRVAVHLRVRDDDRLKALPDVEERTVPRLGRLGVVGCDDRRRHR
jgi:hypothetical protein